MGDYDYLGRLPPQAPTEPKDDPERLVRPGWRGSGWYNGAAITGSLASVPGDANGLPTIPQTALAPPSEQHYRYGCDRSEFRQL